MNIQDLFNELAENKNDAYAMKMYAYMRNQFPFFGIPSSLFKPITHKYYSLMSKSKSIDFSFVDRCFTLSEREYQYVGIGYLCIMKDYLVESDITNLQRYITTKSWWDSVDSFNTIIAAMALKYPNINEVMLQWSINDNIWLKRMSIIYQISLKEKTNTDVLAKVIKNNLNQKEFFINKAIGWSLRAYSKTNKEWVKDFINSNKNDLSKLSIKEGSKYL